MPNLLNLVLTNFSGTISDAKTMTWDANQLKMHIELLQNELKENIDEDESIGLVAENSPWWIAIDLALLKNSHISIPIPPFFSQEQIEHIIFDASIKTIISDNEQPSSWGFIQQRAIQNTPYTIWKKKFHQHKNINLDNNNTIKDARLTHHRILKITFTSGSSGKPKGVLLHDKQLESACKRIYKATHPLNIRTHLCILPFSVLLENIAGVYTAMMNHAHIITPEYNIIYKNKNLQLNALACINLIEKHKVESIITVPNQLQQLLDEAPTEKLRTQSLKLIAVGGAKLPTQLMKKAQQLKLPVHEGYGLSECASVVSLNLSNRNTHGTVGKVLDGLEVRINSDQEIEIKGSEFIGYLQNKHNSTHTKDGWFKTGDIGHIDDQNIMITGRKDNLIVLNNGRNISPEWIECKLLGISGVLQAIVLQPNEDHIVTWIALSPKNTINMTIDAIKDINTKLPEYAMIKECTLTKNPLNIPKHWFTGTGKPIRKTIQKEFYTLLESHEHEHIIL